MKQVARLLLECEDGFLRNTTRLNHDRDSHVSRDWRAMLGDDGVASVPTPRRSANGKADPERLIRLVQSEHLNHFLILGRRNLQHILREYVEHYNAERNQHRLGGELFTPTSSPQNDNGSSDRICRRPRLGGILNIYHRTAP